LNFNTYLFHFIKGLEVRVYSLRGTQASEWKFNLYVITSVTRAGVYLHICLLLTVPLWG